jgi:S1-C subfamily serine protease
VLRLFPAAVLLSGCYRPTPLTPEVAEESTYKIITPSGGQCTGWVVDEDGHLVTAGHCCDEDGDYSLISTSNRVGKARVIAFEDDSSDAPPTDVCLMKAYGSVAAPLPLAGEMPDVGDKVFFVGFPRGIYKRSEGAYRGDVDGDSRWHDFSSSAPCDRGASGSAMLSEDGAWGVLVRLHFTGETVLPGDFGCVASPLDQILSILQHR